MRIKHIIFSTFDSIGNPFYNGGGARAIHEIAKRLSKYYKITVIAGNYPGAVNRQIDGVFYHYHGYRLSPKISQLSYVLTLPYIVRRLDPDLVIESFTPPFSISLLPVLATVPVVGLVHMLSGRDMERKYHLPFTWIENIGLNWYKHFIVLSSYWQNIIRSVNSSASFTVIPNAVETSNLAYRPKERYFVFLGRIEINQKGIDLLLEAWGKQNTSAKLVIAGAGDANNISDLTQSIKLLKNPTSVEYLGHVKGTIKRRLISNALATIIPSRYETFSMTALESLAHGTPIISFDIPGMDWISSNSVLRAKSFDSTSLADCLKKIASNKTLRVRLSHNARLESKKYNFTNTVKQYRQIIEDLT